MGTILRLCQHLKAAGSGPDVTGPWVRAPQRVRRLLYSRESADAAFAHFRLRVLSAFVLTTSPGHRRFSGRQPTDEPAPSTPSLTVEQLSAVQMRRVDRAFAFLRFCTVSAYVLLLLTTPPVCRQAGWSALHAACACAHDAAALRLLERGADVTCTDLVRRSSLAESGAPAPRHFLHIRVALATIKPARLTPCTHAGWRDATHARRPIGRGPLRR